MLLAGCTPGSDIGCHFRDHGILQSYSSGIHRYCLVAVGHRMGSLRFVPSFLADNQIHLERRLQIEHRIHIRIHQLHVVDPFDMVVDHKIRQGCTPAWHLACLEAWTWLHLVRQLYPRSCRMEPVQLGRRIDHLLEASEEHHWPRTEPVQQFPLVASVEYHQPRPDHRAYQRQIHFQPRQQHCSCTYPYRRQYCNFDSCLLFEARFDQHRRRLVVVHLVEHWAPEAGPSSLIELDQGLHLVVPQRFLPACSPNH
mmetsp:Transcript_16689/g.27685  ORF Transcript_16689/g.27685 Transcript_16689/m.27685 type:complete len:254 (-) Transcript_16689:1461-2222(-)